MSRLYDNKSLDNLPVHVIKWDGAINDISNQPKSCRDNPGILCEGKIVKQARISVATSDSAASQQVRFFILFVSIERAHRRLYDDSGVEQEPNFSQTTKVSTGYLNSSYDVKSRGKSDSLSPEEVVAMMRNSKITDMVAPIVSKQETKGDVQLLMREEERLKIELEEDSAVRIKTCGNSPFVESLVLRDHLTSTKGNFAGDEKMGDNWLEKIAAAKAAQSKEEEPSEIADEEWDD